jgi:hypothetical protein
VPIVLKSGSLNLLEPSWPVKACNGIALPCFKHDIVREQTLWEKAEFPYSDLDTKVETVHLRVEQNSVFYGQEFPSECLLFVLYVEGGCRNWRNVMSDGCTAVSSEQKTVRRESLFPNLS